MKSTRDELSIRYMALIKIDASNLINRIKQRQHEYIEAFSLKRDRDIFKDIFRCRYQQTTMFDLAHLPSEIIEVANDFYTSADELLWYLMNTQDMPNTIEDEISRFIHQLTIKYESLCLYIDAELGGTSLQEVMEEEEIPHDTSEANHFLAEGEVQAIENTDDT